MKRRSAESKSSKKSPAAPGAKVDRRQEILDAALERFASTGFQGTSVRDIARSVGLNEATLYHYFRSKGALLDAIISDLVEERRRWLSAVDDPKASLEGVLARVTSGFLKRMRAERERKLVRLMMIEGPRLAVQGKYPFLELVHVTAQQIMDMFRALIGSGRMRPADARFLALQFVAPIMWYGQHQHGLGGQTEEPISESEFVEAHVDLFVRAFGA
jgi:AcrR family transcriptional regulator